MEKLRISLIAYPEAPGETFERGESIIKEKLNDMVFEIVNDKPDALFILSGGSEMQAKELLKSSKHILILSMTENNSYAAATEIKSYCNKKEINSVLYNIDYENDIGRKINFYIKSKQALSKISKYSVGLIGNVSEWLINSDIERPVLQNKFGLKVQNISWNDFPKYSEYNSDNEFINHFKDEIFDLNDSSKVYKLLQDIVHKKQLDAITVECFPLVRENAVTACLALSKFNTEGLPAGCEGDITSITGKILIKELTGQIPWMANLAGIENDKVFFAHCTIATNLVNTYKINTHFETNMGTAVQGQFKYEDVTIFRLDNELSKAFLSYGRIVERPERNDSCRTQIKIELPDSDIQKLKENPLGNHHLIIPGDHRELIHFLLQMTQIELV